MAILAPANSKQLFSLALSAPKEPIKAGANLDLLVTVTNTSARKIAFIVSPGPLPEDGWQYEITVRDSLGRPAPPSAYVRNLDKRLPLYPGGSTVGRTLAPGESFVDEVDVTMLYDLSRPGKYTISVSRDFPPRQNLGEGRVLSNTITVTVVE